MVRVGTILFLVTMLAVTEAHAEAPATVESSHVTSLRAPRLAVGLLSFEAGAFSIATIGLFAAAIAEAATPCGPSDTVCDIAPALAGLGVAGLALSSWSIVVLVHSVRELQWRREGAYDNARSMIFNRLMISYDAILPLVYFAAITPVYVNLSEGERFSAGSGIALGGVTALAGLHLWSLVLNAKELKRRKRLGTAFVETARGPQFTGTGVRW